MEVIIQIIMTISTEKTYIKIEIIRLIKFLTLRNSF